MRNKFEGLHVLIHSGAGAERNPPVPTTELTEIIVNGGASFIQLRDKNVDDETLVRLGTQMIELFGSRNLNIPLIINDRVEVALALKDKYPKAQLGIHVGQSDMPATQVRELIGDQMMLGVSAATVHEAVKAEQDGADYVGVGPVFKTVSKQDAVEPIGLQGLQEIRDRVSIPVVVIGGINEHNARNVIESGADGIAVIGAVLRAEDPGQASQTLSKILKTPTFTNRYT